MKECFACRRCFGDHNEICDLDGSMLKPTLSGLPIIANKYRLDERLGTGSMGMSYLGYDIEARSPIAIKVILPDYAQADPKCQPTLFQEVEDVCSINHPNVVRILDYGKTPTEFLYVVMEYIEGRPLSEILGEQCALALERSIHYTTQICAAIDAAHRRGQLHRDIKPSNIVTIVGKTGESLRVLDFGMSRIKSSTMFNRLTPIQTSNLQGLPFYSAPEISQGEDIDERSDIYSIGVLLYHMLTGELPFKGATFQAVLEQKLTITPRIPSDVKPLIPDSVELAVMRAIDKDPDRRLQSVAAFSTLLRRALLRPALLVPGKRSAQYVSRPLPSLESVLGTAPPILPPPPTATNGGFSPNKSVISSASENVKSALRRSSTSGLSVLASGSVGFSSSANISINSSGISMNNSGISMNSSGSALPLAPPMPPLPSMPPVPKTNGSPNVSLPVNAKANYSKSTVAEDKEPLANEQEPSIPKKVASAAKFDLQFVNSESEPESVAEPILESIPELESVAESVSKPEAEPEPVSLPPPEVKVTREDRFSSGKIKDISIPLRKEEKYNREYFSEEILIEEIERVFQADAQKGSTGDSSKLDGIDQNLDEDQLEKVLSELLDVLEPPPQSPTSGHKKMRRTQAIEIQKDTASDSQKEPLETVPPDSANLDAGTSLLSDTAALPIDIAQAQGISLPSNSQELFKPTVPPPPPPLIPLPMASAPPSLSTSAPSAPLTMPSAASSASSPVLPVAEVGDANGPRKKLPPPPPHEEKPGVRLATQSLPKQVQANLSGALSGSLKRSNEIRNIIRPVNLSSAGIVYLFSDKFLPPKKLRQYKREMHNFFMVERESLAALMLVVAIFSLKRRNALKLSPVASIVPVLKMKLNLLEDDEMVLQMVNGAVKPLDKLEDLVLKSLGKLNASSLRRLYQNFVETADSHNLCAAEELNDIVAAEMADFYLLEPVPRESKLPVDPGESLQAYQANDDDIGRYISQLEDVKKFIESLKAEPPVSVGGRKLQLFDYLLEYYKELFRQHTDSLISEKK